METGIARTAEQSMGTLSRASAQRADRLEHQAGVEWFAPFIFHLIHGNLANAPSAVSRDLA